MSSQTHKTSGRPSTFKPEYTQMLLDFFNVEPYRKEVMEKSTQYFQNGVVKSTSEKYRLIPNTMPTLFDFGRSLSEHNDGKPVPRQTLHRWANLRVGSKPGEGEKDTRPFKNVEFRDAYKQVEKWQTRYLVEIGLAGASPAAFTIFTAKNVIGWRDKTETGFTDKDGKDVSAQGYIVLPRRLDDAAALKQYYEQEGMDPETGLPKEYGETDKNADIQAVPES